MAAFLSSWHIENLRAYKYNVSDRAILSKLYQPLWNWMLSFIPESVHPNMLTFCSFTCILVGYRLSLGLQFSGLQDPSLDNMASRPFWSIIAMQILCSAYMHLDALDGKQARKLRCSSPIGELLDHALDNIGMIFGVLSLTNAWGITAPIQIYLLTFSCSIGFFASHLDAYLSKEQVIVFGKFSGPCEAILLYQIALFASLWRKRFFLEQVEWYALVSYIPTFFASVTGLYMLGKLLAYWRDAQRSTWVIGSIMVYAIRACNAYYNMLEFGNSTMPAKMYILEGLILSCVTTEVILCKMSKAPFSSLLLLLSLVGFVSEWAGILCSVAYYIQLFWGLSDALKIPLFRLKRRVYCCGVFDMCHRGHMNLFKRCLKLGDTVVVGVHNDEDVMSYKHNPVVSHEERALTVEHCQFVGEVIRNAPLCLTDKFLKEHKIDVVVCSDEYDSPTDHYYAAARAAGILHVFDRTSGISSSALRVNASTPRISTTKSNPEAETKPLENADGVANNADDRAPRTESPKIKSRSKSPGSVRSKKSA